MYFWELTYSKYMYLLIVFFTSVARQRINLIIIRAVATTTLAWELGIEILACGGQADIEIYRYRDPGMWGTGRDIEI